MPKPYTSFLLPRCPQCAHSGVGTTYTVSTIAAGTMRYHRCKNTTTCRARWQTLTKPDGSVAVLQRRRGRPFKL
jgi:hypothetical protein